MPPRCLQCAFTTPPGCPQDAQVDAHGNAEREARQEELDRQREERVQSMAEYQEKMNQVQERLSEINQKLVEIGVLDPEFYVGSFVNDQA